MTIRKDPSATLLAGPKLEGPLEISDSSGMLPGQGIQDLAPSALQSEKEHSSLAVSLENNMHRVLYTSSDVIGLFQNYFSKMNEREFQGLSRH